MKISKLINKSNEFKMLKRLIILIAIYVMVIIILKIFNIDISIIYEILTITILIGIIIIVAIYLKVTLIEWHKSINKYEGKDTFKEVDESIRNYLENTNDMKNIFAEINKLYKENDYELNVLFGRQNFLRYKLKLTGHILELILSTGIALIITFLTSKNDYTIAFFTTIGYIGCCFVIIFFISLFITLQYKPKFSHSEEFYKYEYKLIGETIYDKIKSMRT